MKMRPFGVGWYSRSPDHLRDRGARAVGADDERRPQVARRRRDPGDTAALHHQPGDRGPGADLGARLRGGATRISSSVIRRTLRTGAPVIATTSSTDRHVVEDHPRRSIGGASFRSDSRTPSRSRTWTPAGWIPCVEGVSLGKRVLVDEADPQAGAGEHRRERRARRSGRRRRSRRRTRSSGAGPRSLSAVARSAGKRNSIASSEVCRPEGCHGTGRPSDGRCRRPPGPG